MHTVSRSLTVRLVLTSKSGLFKPGSRLLPISTCSAGISSSSLAPTTASESSSISTSASVPVSSSASASAASTAAVNCLSFPVSDCTASDHEVPPFSVKLRKQVGSASESVSASDSTSTTTTPVGFTDRVQQAFHKLVYGASRQKFASAVVNERFVAHVFHAFPVNPACRTCESQQHCAKVYAQAKRIVDNHHHSPNHPSHPAHRGSMENNIAGSSTSTHIVCNGDALLPNSSAPASSITYSTTTTVAESDVIAETRTPSQPVSSVWSASAANVASALSSSQSIYCASYNPKRDAVQYDHQRENETLRSSLQAFASGPSFNSQPHYFPHILSDSERWHMDQNDTFDKQGFKRFKQQCLKAAPLAILITVMGFAVMVYFDEKGGPKKINVDPSLDAERIASAIVAANDKYIEEQQLALKEIELANARRNRSQT